MQQFDVAIIGGGAAGLSLALALANAHLRVVVLEAKVVRENDARLFGLNKSTCQFLENIFIWPALFEIASPIATVHVSYKGHFGSVRLSSHELGLSELGYVVPARHLESALRTAVLKQPEITLLQPCELLRVEETADNLQLHIKNGDREEVIFSHLLIGADGTHSTVREQFNIAAEVIDYKQTAIVTITTLQRGHDHVAYERFTGNGAIAMLPLMNLVGMHQVATIWTLPTEEAEQLLAQDDTEFLSQLQKTFGYRLGKFKRVSERFHYPLQMVKAKQQATKRMFILGNAAHTCHPIAAQGLNLAIYEVAALAEMLSVLPLSVRDTQFDLQKLVARVERHQKMSIEVSHRLAMAFSDTSILNSIALPLGMLGMDMLPPLKKKFINLLLGRTGNVPSLLMPQILH